MIGVDDADRYLDLIRDDGRGLVDAVVLAPEDPVPTCPGWTLADLLGHTSGAHRWASHVLEHGDDSHRRDLPDPPADLDELVAWYQDGLATMVSIMDRSDPTTLVWTPTAGQAPSSWWRRKMAVETALHRWDGQHALCASSSEATAEAPIDGRLAVHGIDELVDEFLSPILAFTPDSPTGVVALVPTDEPERWLLDLDHADGSAVVVTAVDAEADVTTVRGTASDLLLWSWNRRPGPQAHVSSDDDGTLFERWATLKI